MHLSFGVPSEKEDKHSKTPAELDAIAVAKWETILHFMVSKGGQVDVGGQAPKASVLYLLANSGLMADPYVLPLALPPPSLAGRRAALLYPD